MRSSLTLFVSATFILMACGKNDGNSGDGLSGERGVVQGVVVDALTGERVAIPDSNGARGINILTNHTHKSAAAKSYGYEEADANLLKGEYVVTDVPVGQRYPIVANIEGYQTFEGEIFIEKGDTEKRAKCKTDECRAAIATPTFIANIAVYPQGKFNKDVKLELRKGETRIENAKVVIKPATLRTSTDSALDLRSNHDFLRSKTTRITPILEQSNVDGNIMIKGGDLVLGQEYAYIVYTERSNIPDVSGSFVVGASPYFNSSLGSIINAQEENDRFTVRIDL